MASTLFLSCQNEEEPITPPHNGLNNSELVEYSISVNVPDEMRTRAAEGTIGETGLFEYPGRTVNRLRYAIYNETILMSNNTLTRSGSDPFKISLTLENNIDPTQVYLFFWADTNGDTFFDIDFTRGTITQNYNSNSGDGYMSPKDLGYKDAFTGYFQLSSARDDKSRSRSYTLRRPFAEIHILTDEIEQTNLKDFFDTGTKSYIGYGDGDLSFSTCKNQIFKPEKWHFTASSDGFYERGDFEFYQFPCLTGTSYQSNFPPFSNPLDGSLRTEFKGRQMEYIGCFYVFVPENGSFFNFKDNSGTRKLNKINVGVVRRTANFVESQTRFISLEFPEEGLKANHKYVYYNKSFENGGSGFLDGLFSYEIFVNHDIKWTDPDTETEVE